MIKRSNFSKSLAVMSMVCSLELFCDFVQILPFFLLDWLFFVISFFFLFFALCDLKFIFQLLFLLLLRSNLQVGYILGLGDRHPSNIMMHKHTGKVIHIDFGDCFEVAIKREKFPEKIPFRYWSNSCVGYLFSIIALFINLLIYLFIYFLIYLIYSLIFLIYLFLMLQYIVFILPYL
jgi:hypothetical protein